MPIRSSDALVLGGGVEGLSCAFRLAKAGYKVTLLEASATLGGKAAAREFHTGFTAAIAHLMPTLDPRLSAAMDLAAHGLSFAATDIATTLLSPEGNLTVQGRTTSGPDATAWALLHDRLSAHAAALAPFRGLTPPRLSRGAGADALALLRPGLGLRLAGRDRLRDLLRLLLTNAADVAEDELTDPRLQGLLAFDATLGAWAGPRSPGTLILHLNRLAMGPRALPRGGMGAVVAAMARAAEAAGVALRTSAPVARIRCGERIEGVTLTDGTEIDAPLVVSALSPVTTFRDLVGPRHLDTGFFRRTGHIRARGAAAKFHLALKSLPDFKADPTHRLVIAPSVDAVEEAWNPVKYGDVPAHPVLEALLPTALDPTLAPEGQHILSAVVQFAPHAPTDPDEARADLLENTLKALEPHAPGLRDLILHAELLMPSDITAMTGSGAWHGADLAVEQMFFLRPLHELARYATPIPGLWLAGSGAHPGGGVTGTAGWNAAERIRKEAA